MVAARCIGITLVAVAAIALSGGAAAAERTAFKVCADPHYLPWSNRARRRVRESDCFASGRRTEPARRVHLVPAAHGVHPQYSPGPGVRRRIQVRRRHGSARRLRAGDHDGALLPLDLRPGLRQGTRAWTISSRPRTCWRSIPPGATRSGSASPSAIPAPSGWPSTGCSTRSRLLTPRSTAIPRCTPASSSRKISSRTRLTPPSCGVLSPATSPAATRTSRSWSFPMASEPGVRLHFGISAGVRFGQKAQKEELQNLLDGQRGCNRRHPARAWSSPGGRGRRLALSFRIRAAHAALQGPTVNTFAVAASLRARSSFPPPAAPRSRQAVAGGRSSM